jgi:hypothetical protein
MAKILKCPRCQSSMDVTSVSPGSTVRCPDCGQMARVPAGATSLAVKTISQAIPPPAPAPAARERGTRVRERGRSSGTNPTLPPPGKSGSGLWIGLGIGAVAVVVVIVAFTMKGHDEAPPAPRTNAPKETGTVTFAPKLPPSSEKPIVLGSGEKKDDPKPTQISKPAETVDNVNWDALIRELRAGGGFDHPDRPEGVAFQKVKSFGKAAYPKLVAYIDHEQPEFGIAAVAVLNALTGRDSALPKGVTKSKVKAEWEEWLKSGGDAKPDAPKDAPK